MCIESKIGFEDSLLLHDGQWSRLTPDDTIFVNPNSPWQLFFLDPNRGYGVGNYAIEAIDGNFDKDGDVDSSDLAGLILWSGTLDIASFALNFGLGI